ncbi:MAG: Na/Pi cotransporter family protein [Thermodesulfobacteriota bacterium]|nr:Na/Pi cotransporter family protein [Thermodesulfobacteriota bacterium]
MDFKIISVIIGGLGLFLFGMYLLSDSLKKLSLGLLKTMLEKVTAGRFRAASMGAFVTAAIQSSSATSVIVIGFLNAGFMPLAAAVAIMIGANVGTTITAQLIAFKLTAIAPLFVFAGTVIFLAARKDKHKNKGRALLGFGLLFMGLAMMSSAVKPLADDEAIKNIFISFSTSPFLGILTGMIVTAMLQSSSTTTGMIIAFASAGLLDLHGSVHLLFGVEIGTCITAGIASIGGSLSSKRLALGHTVFNVTGTLIMLPLIPLYLHYIPMISGDIARQIANTHTAFNVINALIFLPLVPIFVKLLNRVIPGKDYKKKEIKHLDSNLFITPNLAIKAAIREMLVMLSICWEMFEKAEKCIISYNHRIRNEIALDEDSVDEMQKNITEYLVKLTKGDLSDKERNLVPALLHSVNDLERVGDYCESIVKLSHRGYEHDLRFSTHAKIELGKLFEKTHVLMRQTKKAIENDDHKAAAITLNINREIHALVRQNVSNHIDRLEKGECISDAGLVYTDLLTAIERITDHLCNITKGILHIGKR